MNLNSLENDIAKEIINIGISKAADSLTFFINQKVLVRIENVGIKPTKDESIFVHKGESKYYVLTTEIKGEMKGISFLIFSEEEIQQLYRSALPASIVEDPENLAMHGEAVLLEIDNIISAAVITQFANFFKYKIYGDVPGLKVLEGEKAVNEFISSFNTLSDYYLYFSSKFINDEINVTPTFIWFLGENYIDGVRKIANDESALDALKNK